jgi:hypothetical protein
LFGGEFHIQTGEIIPELRYLPRSYDRDYSFYFSFFPGCPHVAGAWQETVFAGEGQKAGMKPHQVAVVLGDGSRQVVIPEFPCDSAQELESVEVTAHEGLETLAVRELHKQFAAVAFHQTEGIELARVTLVRRAPKCPQSISKRSPGPGSMRT